MSTPPTQFSDVITRYERGGSDLRAAVAGLTQAQLLMRPVAGTWSIQQIVIHLMDSDLIGADRMKRIIAEESPPTLVGYNESLFADHLSYDLQPVEDAVTVFDLNRRLFARVLRKLPPAAFERTGMHTETGRVTLGWMLPHYVEHLDHHLDFIRRKRAMIIEGAGPRRGRSD
jgi:hypothetical protein